MGTKKPMPGWAKNAKKHCVNNKHSGSYTSLFKAQEACVKLGSKCSGVYDPSCDGKDVYYTCTTAKWATSSSSCIYSAPKGATTTKKPMSGWAKRTKKHCWSSKHPTKYSSVFKAQEACLKLGSKCSGVYDENCDDKPVFYTCTTAKWSTSSSSCVYEAPKATTWVKNAKKHCLNTKHTGNYATLAKAQEACLKLGSKCSGVYDSSCDGRNTFYTCTTAKWATSTSSCVYSPQGGRA